MIRSFLSLNELTDRKQPVLSRGDLISIRHVISSQDAYATLVQSVAGDTLSFRLPPDLMRFEVLAVGDRVQLMHFDEKCELYLEGAIASLDLRYPWLVTVLYDTVRRIPNRRSERRCIVNLPAQIQMHDQQEPRLDAVIRNINRKGVALATRRKLDSDSGENEFLICFSTPEGARIEFQGRLVRHDAMERFHLHGVEITRIDDASADAMERLLFRLQEDERIFIAENLK